MELTLAAAIVAGLLSFLSPCVLPVVPAYLGQLGALAAAPAFAAATTAAPATAAPATAAPAPTVQPRTRWQVLPHALAFVLGFAAVFTALGLTGALIGRAIPVGIPVLRILGGLLLVVLGLDMAGVFRIPLLARTWRPLDRSGPGSSPLPSRTPLGAFSLGAVFGVGWTPCIGPTLGAIFGLSALGATPQVGLLFVAYSLGLGIPFIVMALAMDRAPALIRPLRRHARIVELIGGSLVVLIGLAIIFDWLGFFARTFSFLWPQV
jgi:cytochrome c-type biogenesis protein